MAAAAHGSRGRVEVRDAGDQALLTDDTPSLHAIDLAEISDTAPGAALTNTRSLSEASDLIRQFTATSELDYETAKAAKRNGQSRHAVTVADLRAIDQHANGAAGRRAETSACVRLRNSSAQRPSTPMPTSAASSQPNDLHATHHRSTEPLSNLALVDQGPGFARPGGASSRCAAGHATNRPRSAQPCESLGSPVVCGLAGQLDRCVNHGPARIKGVTFLCRSLQPQLDCSERAPS